MKVLSSDMEALVVEFVLDSELPMVTIGTSYQWGERRESEESVGTKETTT